MIIRTLKMENFRQFFGSQFIEFGSQEQNQFVTIVHGENGRGKTGIYRAILFALYGDRHLDQDSSDSNIVLTNIKALEEDRKNEHKGVQCIVQLEFTHENKLFTIEREIMAYLEEDGNIIERVQRVQLHNHDLQETITDEEKVQAWIHSILDERVKNYFFFDGERIERLTRASHQQRLEIASGIKNLLKIDHLLKARNVLTHIQRNVSKQLQKYSTGEYKKTLTKKMEIEEQLEGYKKRKLQLKEESDSIESQIHHIDEQLQAFHEKADEISKRKELERFAEKLEEERQFAMKQLTQFNGTLQLLLAKDALFFVKAQLDQLLGKEEQESTIRLELLDQILADLTCICGTKIEENSKAFHHLETLRKTVKQKENQKDLYQFKAELLKLLGYLEDKDKTLQSLLEGVKQKEQELEEIWQQIDYMNQRLKDTAIEDLDQLNRKREELVQQRAKVNFQYQDLEEKIHQAQSVLEQLEWSLRDLKVKSGVHQKLIRKLEEVEQSNKAMDRMIKQFEQDVISELELVSTQNLFYLLDESGRMNIKKVKVLDDYSLEVINSFGQPFLANISQGQRQVLSLSFITALAQVAGGTKSLELPLFMDTPFGRLSGKHQQNLLDYIPQVCSQWILLVTDKEFGESEKRRLVEQGYVGKYYVLESTEPGVTQIIEKPIK